FSPGGDRVVTLCGNAGYVWNVRTRERLGILRGHESRVTTAAFSSDGKRVLTGSEDNTGILWDAETGKMLAFFRGHKGPVTHVAFSRDGKTVATASGDATARLWQTDLLPLVAGKKPRELSPAERGRYEIQAVAAISGRAATVSDAAAVLPTALPLPGSEIVQTQFLPKQTLDAATAAALNRQLARVES